MFDGVNALKLAAVVAVALLLPTTYLVYKKGNHIKPPKFLKKEDCNYKLEKPQPCTLTVDQQECIKKPKPTSCSLTVNRKDCIVKETYCHVNIWALAKKIQNEHPEEVDNIYAVFVANSNEDLRIYRQIEDSPLEALFYDFHVVLMYSKDKYSWVFDFATTLPFPEELKSYVDISFSKVVSYYAPGTPLFRVIKAKNFIEMFNPERDASYGKDGQEPVLYQYSKLTLGEPYSERFGEVLNREQFLAKFTTKE